MNAKTLEVLYAGGSVADVLGKTVGTAAEFFAKEPTIARVLETLQGGGLRHLRLGEAATELSGSEAQRVKLATELQRAQTGRTLYVLD